MSKSIVQLTNNFHNTKTAVLTEDLNHGTHLEITLSSSQKKRAAKKLCGMSDCVCGGIRGSQSFGGKKLVVNVFPL